MLIYIEKILKRQKATDEINENMRARGNIIRETIIQRYFT